MNELPFVIEQAVRRYEKIETDGLILWPVRVKEYNEFLMARPALEIMHQSLPVAMMRIPLLSALYKMDYEAAISGKPPTGLFSRALLALALSLRLGEGQEAEERLKRFRVAVERGKPETLLRVCWTDGRGEEQSITPARFQNLRRIIAAQNGVKVESDKANPNIVQAQKDLGTNGVQLDANVYDLVSAVSALSGAGEAEIDEWPIMRLEAASRSWRRILDYLICGFGEVNGTTWKNGNPTPHPFFGRARDGGGAMRVLDSGAGQTVPETVQKMIDQGKQFPK